MMSCMTQKMLSVVRSEIGQRHRLHVFSAGLRRYRWAPANRGSVRWNTTPPNAQRGSERSIDSHPSVPGNAFLMCPLSPPPVRQVGSQRLLQRATATQAAVTDRRVARSASSFRCWDLFQPTSSNRGCLDQTLIIVISEIGRTPHEMFDKENPETAAFNDPS